MQLIGRTFTRITALSRSTRYPVTCEGDGQVRVWSSPNPDALASGATALATLQNGVLVLGTKSGRLVFLDRWTKRHKAADGHASGPIRLLAVDTLGRFVAAGSDYNDLTVWRDGRRLWTATGVHDFINSVTIGPDHRVYTGGERDRSIAVHSLPTGKELRRYESPGKDVCALVVSRDGRHWVSCADCNEWMLWSVTDSEPRCLGTDQFGTCALETPDGKGVLVAGSDSLMLYSWKGESQGRLKFSSPRQLAWGSDQEIWIVSTQSDRSESQIWSERWVTLREALVG